MNRTTQTTPPPSVQGQGAAATPTEEKMLQAVMGDHDMEHRYKKKEGTGGIFPACIDPDTGRTYFLLGLNHNNHYCHFHGWIDPHETMSFGCAREGWEESAGAYAPLLQLWRAVTDSQSLCQMLKGTNILPPVSTACWGKRGQTPVRDGSAVSYYFPFNHNMRVVVLGHLNEEQRLAICQKFHTNPKFYSCMEEVQCIDWVDGISFRDTCQRFAHDDLHGYAQYYQQTKKKVRISAVVGNNDFPVSGFRERCTLRSFLQDWLAAPETSRSWNAPEMKQLIDHGTLAQSWLPLSKMPALSETGTRMLCKNLGIPFCEDTKEEGHFTGMCQHYYETAKGWSNWRKQNPKADARATTADYERYLPRRTGFLFFTIDAKNGHIMVWVDDSAYSGQQRVRLLKEEADVWLQLLPLDHSQIPSIRIPVTYHPQMRSLHSMVARSVKMAPQAPASTTAPAAAAAGGSCTVG